METQDKDARLHTEIWKTIPDEVQNSDQKQKKLRNTN